MKRLYSILLAILAVLFLFGCSAKAENGVQVYTMEEKVDSATVNRWKTLYLLDGDNYALTVYALDPLDGSTVTVDFYMAGKYTKNKTGTVTLHAGYGHAEMRHGDIPVQLPIQPDANGQMSALYRDMIGESDTFILNKDGTWTGA